MQKPTAPERVLSPVEGVLLKADYLARRRRAMDIIESAKQEASRILSAASAEAEILREEARREGFRLGVLSCADIIASWVAEQNTLYASMLRECKAELHSDVMELFGEVAFINHLAEHWVSEQVAGHEQTVHMRAHHSYKVNHVLFEGLFAERKMNVSVEYSDVPGFHFRCGQFVLELSPDTFAAIMSEKAVTHSRSRGEFIRLCDESRRLISEKLTEL